MFTLLRLTVLLVTPIAFAIPAPKDGQSYTWEGKWSTLNLLYVSHFLALALTAKQWHSFFNTVDCSNTPSQNISHVAYDQNWVTNGSLAMKVDRPLLPGEHLDFSKPGRVDKLCGDFTLVYGEGQPGGQLPANECFPLMLGLTCYRFWRKGSEDTGDVPN